MPLHQLRSITVGVTDVSTTSAFYEAFGLTASGEVAPDSRSFSTQDGGEQFRLVSAPWRRIEEIVVSVDDADDVARISSALIAAGHAVTTEGAGLRAREPFANVDLVVSIDPRRVSPVVVPSPVNRPGDTPRLNKPADVVLESNSVRPNFLSHVVIGTPNFDATMAFFINAIGFETSDQIPGIISFNRCSEMHHNLAIQAMPAPFLHHVAFEVDSVDEVLRGGSNMIEADADRHMWGLGRHAIGSNWFWYLKDPAGNFVEYTADLDQITSQDLYVPKAWAGKEFLYAYGPAIPGEFLEPADAKEIFAAQLG
jgi:catechol 2,3-dioxygenase-like lactoylglutathione lyase family enzyme